MPDSHESATIARWRVEITTTYYDVVEVAAADAIEARQRAREGKGISVGHEYSESETHKVERL